MKQDYIDTAALLIDIMPPVFAGGRFAMKGGTAINLFVQDVPRLSVDIDVVLIDHTTSRDDALKAIEEDLQRARVTIRDMGCLVNLPRNADENETKMLVEREGTIVKVEVNFVSRGTVLPVGKAQLVKSAEDMFNASVTIPILDKSELYGSKLVAALDRQHPRDLCDVMYMYKRFGLPKSFVDCFVAYLAGHDRPVHEVLFGPAKDIQKLYERDFVGMTKADVGLQDLLDVQKQLQRDLPLAFTDQNREFLLSLVRTAPDWTCMPFPHLKDMPAIKWKLHNLERLKTKKPALFAAQEDMLNKGFVSTPRRRNGPP